MAATEEDRALSHAIRRGDSAACEAFDAKYRQRIEWIARCRGIRQQDCADIAQEAMAAAFSQMQRGMFRGDSGLGTWLEAIVHGKITDYQRSPGKRPLPSQNSGSDQDGRSREIEPLLVTRPRTEQVLAVREILHRLPRNHRVILTLNKVGGYTTAEIGRRLRWPSGTVGRVLAEAQQTFRELYVESEEFPASQRQSVGDGNG